MSDNAATVTETVAPESDSKRGARPRSKKEAIDPQFAGRGVGQKMSDDQREEVKRFIRHAMQTTTGSKVSSLLQKQFGLTRHSAKEWIKRVEAEDIAEDVFTSTQLQSICQRQLVQVLNDASSPPQAKVQAIKVLVDHFGLTTKPQDATEAEERLVEEAIARMDKMTIQELHETRQALSQGGAAINREMLLFTTDDMETARKVRKAKKATANVRNN